ncbi:hypothetical protein [Croceitalea dokdonensis]|nr:hypothetical protein [Croceitalea dokdonensis]
MFNILWVVFLVPALGFGQGNHQPSLSFYQQLAKKDASYEQGLNLPSSVDDDDFWKDQQIFEEQLLAKNPEGYRTYINKKAELYRIHELSCDESCRHGERFVLKSQFYKEHAATAQYASLPQTKKPQIKN